MTDMDAAFTVLEMLVYRCKTKKKKKKSAHNY